LCDHVASTRLIVMPPFLVRILSGKNTRAISFLLAAASVFVITALYYTQNSFLESFEARTYDLRFKNLRGAIPVNPDIAIIAIDEKSIAEFGRFPWSRTRYVPLLKRLSAAGAREVLFDEFFPEKESAAADRAFAAAIKQAGNVVLGVSFDFDRQLHVTGGTRSIPLIENAAAGIGDINMLPEDDGVNRRNLLLVDDNGKLVPSLGLAGAMAALGETELSTGPFAVRLGQRAIPVDGDNAMWINYTGPPGNYPHYSFADIVDGRIDPALLKGKILFLGATALGVYDMRVTPYSGNVPGVEVHATVADDIISGRFIHRTGIESLFNIVSIIALGLLTFYLTNRMRLYRAIPAAIVLAAAYVWLSYWMFLQGHWVSMVYPPLSVGAALLTGGGFRYLVLERSTREMRSMFSSYLSTKLVAQLEKDPEAARIGGDNKDVTVLFTDIKSFTSFSEKHTAQEVVARLNEYLAAMVQIIYKFDGTVDKFIGDGIMAYWGAPITQPDHARLAGTCAIAMQQAMASLREKWEKDGVESFWIRGGLQSGDVVAGNVGSHGKKMEYTVIGDTVNQAARLESTAKYYGVNFLAGENTYLQSRDVCRYRELDRIRVVGKEKPVAIYELRTIPPGTEDGLAERFAAALSLYRSRKWAEAEKNFAAILADFPGDEPSKIYVGRCREFMTTPPDADWDGVYNRLDK
jgi:adenylate cyclase